MKHVRTRGPNEIIRGDDYNSLLDLVQGMRVKCGPGLCQRLTSSGTYISLNESALDMLHGRGEEQPPGDIEIGVLLELDQTQGTQDTDDWDRDTDNCPVSLQVLTDVKYDTTTHKLTFRTRTMTFTSAGRLDSISAEGDLVEITEAEVCD